MRVIRSPLINVLVRAAERASGALRRDIGETDSLHASRKGVSDFTTSADLRSERTLLKELQKARPDYSVLSEERGSIAATPESGEQASSRRFIIDPLDGTLNFMHAIGHVSISLAVEDNGEIIAGVVHDPLRFETFWCERGVGAFLGDKRLQVSRRETLEDGLYATTLSFNKEQRDERAQARFLTRVSKVLSSCGGLRISGSAALDLAYVAAGRLDGFWAEGLHTWDCAAGLLLVEMAGGSLGGLASSDKPSKDRRACSVFSRCREEGILAISGERQLSSFRAKILDKDISARD